MKLFRNFVWASTGEIQDLLVDEGRVVDRRPHIEAPAATQIDLDGLTVLPAFVDAHCHILPMGLDLQKLHLDGLANHSELLDAIRDRHRDQSDGWLLAVHYDQNRYPEGHLTHTDLDAVSSDRPILLRHTNGHSSIANTAALQAAGVTEETPSPAGGVYARDASGRLNGLLLELAHERVTAAIPKPTLDEMVEAILRAGERMAAWGIGGACDMESGWIDFDREFEAYDRAAAQGCRIETRLYIPWKPVFGPRGIGPEAALARSNRIVGVKLFADGAISSGTAAIYGKFLKPPASRRKPRPAPADRVVDGQLIYAPDRLAAMVKTAHDAMLQVAVHSIGDYATDVVMDAFEAAGDPSRHRIEHAMILSDAQIERLARLRCGVTLQPEFLMWLGPSYDKQLGPDRTAKLIRTRSLLNAGARLAFSSDLPITRGNPIDGIESASNRPERFDPVESCTVEEAFRLYGPSAAEIGGFAGVLGTLGPGEKACFQLYQGNPILERDARLVCFVDDKTNLTNRETAA